MHRLWYDLRVESMFDERLRETVLRIDAALQDMIWRIVTRYSELADREVGDGPRLGLRRPRRALPGRAARPRHRRARDALPTLVDQVHALMPLTLGPMPRAMSNRVDAVR